MQSNTGRIHTHVQCPYNLCHIEPIPVFPDHLLRCRREYERKCDLEGKAKTLRVCKFNENHKVNTVEIKFHEKWCEDRFNAVEPVRQRGNDHRRKEHHWDGRNRQDRADEQSRWIPYRLIPIRLEKHGPILIKDYGHGIPVKNASSRGQGEAEDPRLISKEARVRDQSGIKKLPYREYTEVAESAQSQCKSREDQNRDYSVVTAQREVDKLHHRDYIFGRDQSQGRKGSYRENSALQGQEDSNSGYRQEYGIKRRSGGAGQYPRRDINNKYGGQGIVKNYGTHPLAFNHNQEEFNAVSPKKPKRAKPMVNEDQKKENIWGDAAEDWEAEAKAIEEKEVDQLEELAKEPELIQYEPWTPPRPDSEEKQFQYKSRFYDSGQGSEGDADLDLPVEMETSCYSRNLGHEEDWNDNWVECAPRSSPTQVNYEVMVFEKVAPPRPEVEDLEKEDGECSEAEFDEFIGEDPFSGI